VLSTEHISHLTQNPRSYRDLTRIAGFKVQSANHYTIEPSQVWGDMTSPGKIRCFQSIARCCSSQFARKDLTVLHLVIYQTPLSKATYKGDNSQAKSNKNLV